MYETLTSRIAPLLEKEGISYMLIGGEAVGFYGEPRVTKDVDFAVALRTTEYEKALHIAQKVGLRPLPWPTPNGVMKMPPSRLAQERGFLPFRNGQSNVRVDFIFAGEGYMGSALRRSRKVLMLGVPVRIASAEDLVVLKITTGRAFDLRDVEMILEKGPRLNLVHIRKWLRKFDRETAGEGNYLEIFNRMLVDARNIRKKALNWKNRGKP